MDLRFFSTQHIFMNWRKKMELVKLDNFCIQQNHAIMTIFSKIMKMLILEIMITLLL